MRVGQGKQWATLVLGEDWEHEIKKAVRESDAFVVCLRPGFDDVGVRQKEVRWAIEEAEKRPPGTIALCKTSPAIDVDGFGQLHRLYSNVNC